MRKHILKYGGYRVGYNGELFALEEEEPEFNTRTQVKMLDVEAHILIQVLGRRRQEGPCL